MSDIKFTAKITPSIDHRYYNNIIIIFQFLLTCSVFIPQLNNAEPIPLGPLQTWHFNGLSAEDVFLINNKQMLIEKLHFTDEGPAVWFMVGKGDDEYKQEFANLEGVIIPDEHESCTRLKGYNQVDILLTLPSDMKWTDYDYLSVFCVRFNHNFGYVTLPKDISFTNKTLTEEAKLKVPDTCPQDVEGRVPADDEDDDDKRK